METRCQKCGRELKGKTNCYFCFRPQRRKGEERACAHCDKPFYAKRSAILDVTRKSGTFCSLECSRAAKKGKAVPWATPDKPVIHSAGYVLAWKPDHPRASRGRVFDHILVMESALGRLLEPWEQVHHLDGDKTNNRLENLELHSNSDHQKLHWALRTERKRETVVCSVCGSSFELVPWKAKTTKYCSKECRGRGRWQTRRSKTTTSL
jgi:hypothetical protein